MITSKVIAAGILKAIGLLSVIVLLVYVVYQISTVLIYLLTAFILTLIGNPILSFFKKRLKLNNTLASILTLLLFILVLTGFIMMFIPLVSSQSQSLSLLNTHEIEKNSTELINQIALFLENHNINSTSLLKEINLSSRIDFGFIPNFLNILLETLSSFGIGLASVLFITFFFLKDQNIFLESAKKLIANSQKDKILNSIQKINYFLSRYFIGLLIQLFVVFILYFIVLLIFGIHYAFIIAFICAILNIIPYVGPIIGTFLATVLTMIDSIGNDFQTEILPTTIYVLIGFCIVQIIDNNISQPLIFSKSVSSHPLEIFLIVILSGFLFGILGMIVAIPLLTVLKVIGKEFLPENKIIQLFTRNM